MGRLRGYPLRSSGEVIEIINRRGRARPKRIVVRGRMRSRRIVVWVSAILLLGLVVVFGLFLGASLRRQSNLLREETGKVQTVLDENAKRQRDIQRMEKDLSFLPMFELFRMARADAEMYRQMLVTLFRLNSAQVRRTDRVLRELRPLYYEILKYEDRVENGDVDEALFNGLKTLMQTAFAETMARICGQPLAACRKWVEPFLEPSAPPRLSTHYHTS